jgi:hypothetical protein
MSSIAQRQYTFNVGPLPFAHNFLVLYDDQGNVVAELHGNPANPADGTELHKYIGRSTDNLGAFETPGKSEKYIPGQEEKILWEGSEDVMARWRAAREVANEINRRGLTYNLWGSDLNGPRDWDAPVPPVIAGNSNSVNRTLIDAMALQMPGMPTMAPGTENPLLPQNQIDQIRQNNGIPPVPKGGLF